MGIWKDLNDWIDNLIFPKSDSMERRFQKKIALHQVTSSLFFAFGGSIIALGIGFTVLALSLITEAASFDPETQQSTIGFFSNFAGDMVEMGSNFLYIGFSIIVFGVFFVFWQVIREN